MRLLVRPSPRLDECLPDFVGRVSASNGLRSDYTVGIALGCFRHPRPPQGLDGLRADFPPDELDAIALKTCADGRVTWRDAFFAPGRLRITTLGVCPRCLEETGARHIAWRLRHSRACLVHGCHLLDRCPECQREIFAGAGTTLNCVCGFDWRRAPATAVGRGTVLFQGAEELAELSSFVNRAAIAREPPLFNLPSDLRAAKLVESVLAVLLFRDDCSSLTFRASDEYMEKVGDLLHSGPEAVAHAVTVVRWNFGRGANDSRYRLMLSHLRDVRRAVQDSADNDFLRAIGRHIETGLAEYRRCYRAVPSDAAKDPRDEPGYLNFLQAARQCSVPTSILRRLVRKGIVPSKVVKPRRKIIRRLIEPHIIAQLNEFRLGLFDLYELSERLGISPDLCSWLIKAGVLRGVWGERMRYRDMYRRSDVERVLQRLTDLGQPTEAAHGKTLVPLNHSRHGKFCAKAFEVIAESLLMALRGQVPVYVIDPTARGLSRWGVSEQSRPQARSAALARQVQLTH